MTTAILVANGDLAPTEATLLRPDEGGLTVAVDGGLLHLLSAGITPNVVIGDLDSTPSELVQLAARNGAEILRYPVEKDQTDLELALDLVRDRGMDTAVVYGAFGGRIDHEVANILLVGANKYNSLTIRLRRMVGGYEGSAESDQAVLEEITVVHCKHEFHGQPGDSVTLIPVGRVRGVRTEGLRYALDGEALDNGTTRGVSNVLMEETAVVSVEAGILLAIHRINVAQRRHEN